MREHAFMIILLLIKLAIAAPTASFPVNSQVPPVAQVSEYFEFTFSASTFTSSGDSLTYALSAAPAWLGLNSYNRTLFGTPTSSDVGAPTFELTASDSTGTTSVPVTLVVIGGGGPRLGAPILPQLAQVGPVSSPDALLLYPSQAFTLSFNSNTFIDTSTSTNYYATSGNNTPLPSWLQFNDQNLAFTGTSPPLVSTASYPQIYPVRLIASDVIGFASAAALFEIVVGYNVLTFNITYQSFTLSEGQYFQSPALFDELSLNGNQVSTSDIISVTSDAPDWLTLSMHNISLGGTPPSGAPSQNVTITVTDNYGDIANSTLNFNFSTDDLFRDNLSEVNATIGRFFMYDLGSAIASEATVSVGLGSATGWLTYNAINTTLLGTVPSGTSAGLRNVRITAHSGTRSQTRTLPINIVRRSASPTSTESSSSLRSSATHTTESRPTFSASSSSSSSSPSSSSASSSSSLSSATPLTVGDNNKSHSSRDLAIVLGILLPLLLILLLLLFILCCMRRRRRRRDMETLSKKDISRPIPEEEVGPTVITEISSDGEMLEKQPTRSPEPAPRLELPWAPDSLRRSRARWSKKSSQHGSPFIGSDLEHFIVPSPPIPPRSAKRSSKQSSRRSSRSSRIAAHLSQDSPFSRRISTLNYSRKRTPFRPTQSRQLQDTHPAKRASRALSGISSFSSGLPTRLSGMGHGNGGLGPPGYLQIRESWQNPRNSFLASDDGRMNSADLERFPQPPQDENERSTLQGSEMGGRASLRLVNSESGQRSSLSEERQRYVRDRARDRLESAPRFSSSWSMRPSSSRNSRGIMERLRSPAMSGSFYPDDRTQRDTWRTYSKSSSVGAHHTYQRPETIASEDELPYEEPLRPPPLVLRDRVSYSSGQFDTADESDESAWEDEDIEEALGPDGLRRWQVSANNSPLGSPLERPLDFGEASQGSRPSTSRGYPPPRRTGTSERRWRLGDRRDKRPVSVTEGDLARSQSSQRGDLAFV